MNTLAHLAPGFPDPNRMPGQLPGDFAKGPVAELPYPEAVKGGIRDHRRMDAASDRHAPTRRAKSFPPPGLPPDTRIPKVRAYFVIRSSN